VFSLQGNRSFQTLNAAKNPYIKLLCNETVDSNLHVASSRVLPDVITLVGNKQSRSISDGFLEVFGLIFGHVIGFSDAFRVLSRFIESNATLATELGHVSLLQYPFQIIIF
jgi:hypothetical protein